KAVGADGFVQGSNLNGNVPPQMVYSVDAARYAASMRAAKSPAGMNLKDTFDGMLAENDYESLYLPVSVSRKPTAAQLSKIFDLDMGDPETGQTAKAKIEEMFDTVLLAGPLGSSGIKEYWYWSESGGDYEKHVAVF